MMNKINEAYLEITRNCPLNCEHCYISEKEKEELPREEWFKILEKLKKFNIKRIILLGGEPTSHKNFYDILSYTTSSFSEVVVETSGVGESYFSDYDCSVAISFESCNPRKNDEIRKFRDSKESVYNTAMKKLLIGKKYKNPRILRITLYNDTDILGSIIMAEKVGANLVLMPLINLGNATNIIHRIPTAKKIKEAVETCLVSNMRFKGYHQVQIPQWYLINFDLIKKYGSLFNKQGRVCSAGVQRLFIDYKGNVKPCMFLPQFDFGNILCENMQTINEKINDFNKEIKKIVPNGKCKNCSAWKLCGGGCVASYINSKSKMGETCPIAIHLNNKKDSLKGGRDGNIKEEVLCEV